MLNQIVGDLFSYLLSYLPAILAITFNIVLLIFAILIYKRNSYKYGITLMISSILLIASNIIYISIQYPYLFYRMVVELGLPWSVAELITMLWSLLFLSLNTTSAILLVISIYRIYKTHKKDRIDLNYNP